VVEGLVQEHSRTCSVVTKCWISRAHLEHDVVLQRGDKVLHFLPGMHPPSLRQNLHRELLKLQIRVPVLSLVENIV